MILFLTRLFDRITPLGSTNELEMKNAQIAELQQRWKDNVGRLHSELEMSNPGTVKKLKIVSLPRLILKRQNFSTKIKKESYRESNLLNVPRRL